MEVVLETVRYEVINDFVKQENISVCFLVGHALATSLFVILIFFLALLTLIHHSNQTCVVQNFCGWLMWGRKHYFIQGSAKIQLIKATCNNAMRTL